MTIPQPPSAQAGGAFRFAWARLAELWPYFERRAGSLARVRFPDGRQALAVVRPEVGAESRWRTSLVLGALHTGRGGFAFQQEATADAEPGSHSVPAAAGDAA